jgi:hypothetical protein
VIVMSVVCEIEAAIGAIMGGEFDEATGSEWVNKLEIRGKFD